MNKQHFILLIVPLILVGGILIQAVYQDSGNQKTPVCWNKTQDCSYQTLNTTLESCNDWYVNDPVESLECDRTPNGTENVVLVTDPGNHVTGNVTNNKPEENLIDLGISNHRDLEFLPNGDMIMGNWHANIIIADESGVKSKYNIESKVDSEELNRERTGIKGVAVDPNFEANGRIFVYYFHSNRTGGFQSQFNHNNYDFEVASFKLTNDDELVLIDKLVQIEGAYWHSGGGFEIGPDNKLYLSIGEADQPSWAQDMEKKRGKILRINLDGSVPENNPFEDKYIYSLGHRNPQGIAWNPENNNMWSAEHGNKRHDEINLVEKGNNYGWGRYICDELRESSIELSTEEAVEPVRCFENWTMAPSRMTFVDDEESPWYGDLMVAGLRGKQVRRFEVENGSIVAEELLYFNENDPVETNVARRFRDIEYNNGSLWLLGDEGRGPPASGMIEISPSN